MNLNFIRVAEGVIWAKGKCIHQQQEVN